MPILKITVGISKPKPVSMNKIKKAAKKYKLDIFEFEHYYITKDGFYSYFTTVRDNNLKSSVTRTFIFKNNNFLRPSMIDGCSSDRESFIRQLNDSLSYTIIDSIKCENFLNQNYLIDEEGNKFNPYNIKNDFIILIYWSRFAGILNKTVSRRLAETAEEAIKNGLNAMVIFVNLDMKEDWEL
jgi:hypothetical protein